MDITELNRQISALRGRPVAVGAQVVGELLPDLEKLAADDRVVDDTATNILARALRAVRPRAQRPADRQAAIVALRQAVAEGPRREGGQPENVVPRTVRADPEVWAAIDEIAREKGVSESRATAEVLAMNRCAHPGCGRLITIAAGGVGWCSVEHVPDDLKVFLPGGDPSEVLLRLNAWTDPYRQP